MPVTVWKWKIPTGIVLVGPGFDEPRDLDLPIYAELFSPILRRAQLRISDNQSTVYETQFGGIVAGALEEPGEETYHVMCAISESPLQKMLQRFSKRRQCPESKVSMIEEQNIENNLCGTCRREQGRDESERVMVIP